MNLTSGIQPTREQIKAYMDNWMKWIDNISNQGKLANGGNSFLPHTGKVLKSDNSISDGIYVANEQSLAGYIVVCANNMEDATILAKDCPILQGQNTSVEIRQNNTTQEMKDSKRN
ncbi:MAG: transcription initiation protein [Flavobacteriales bacterium]|nr:transcription initiation protein [Flavobacteriales bacterium]